MYYIIENGEVRKASREQMREDIPSFGYLTLEELKLYYEDLGLPAETVRECENCRSKLRTSIDIYDDVSFGLVSLLDLNNVQGKRDIVGFYVKENMFVVVKVADEDESIGKLFLEAVSRFEKNATLEKIVCAVMERMMDGSVEALERIETYTARLEGKIVNGQLNPDISKEIFRMRNELTIQKHYYEQLIDIGEGLQENANNVLEGSELRYVKIFTDRAGRLSDDTQLLSENLVHLREALNAALDYDLNRIMKMFTVVTTIFLPLTLIAGWYGMNFKNMPELGMKYGYAGVIVLSIIVVLACILFFKKKKFL